MNNNPLLEVSPLPYGAPQFDKIRNEHYLPAFKHYIAVAKSEIDAIVDNPREPDFVNTIEALEFSGKELSGVSDIFFNILEADADDEMQKIAEDVSPMMTEYSMYVSLNKELFSRIKSVYGRRESLGLEKDAYRLLDETYKSFVRQGANLDDENKKTYSGYMEELSLLSLKYGKNVLAATNAFILHIEDEAELEGMPEYVIESAASEAKERNMEGWVFTLNRPSYGPFMKFCQNSELRRRMYVAYNTRAVGGEYENTVLVKRIVELRLKVANLLGYETWADYVLEENMAKDRTTVASFLDGLMTRSLPYARKEVDTVYEFASKNGFVEANAEVLLRCDKLMPWDFSYWAEKYRMSKFSLNEEQLKPYFRLENCIDAVFGLAERLYGIHFEERRDIPVYHKDVKVYDVKDSDGGHLALFYADFFPRATKRGGAWMTEFRGQRIENGVETRPLVSIVTNFTKPTENSPSLLTIDELTTLLHEFGHSLHGMFAKGRYPSLCGTNVARDFVELPSQIMENWAYQSVWLDTFAKDYRTGESMPEDLISKVVASKNYLAGYYQVRQLHFGVLDMAWHSLPSFNEKTDVLEFEKTALSKYQVLQHISGTSISTSFNHIFSGGYSAGYYSYKWAEVLEADAFSLFEKNGVFDKTTASSFRNELLSKGDSEDPAVLYRNFRGQDPDPSALMRKLGLC